MQCHISSLRDEIVPNLDPADKVEGEEEEELGMNQLAVVTS